MEWISGNIFIRPNELPKAGDFTKGHKHNFDHTTIVYKGGIHVKAVLPNGEVIERDFMAPAHCLIRADVTHEITALADDTVYWCVYSHREPNPDGDAEIVQHYTGWPDAYC